MSRFDDYPKRLVNRINNGKIIEQGTHKELIDTKGYYYSLYTKQYEDEATSAVLD